MSVEREPDDDLADDVDDLAAELGEAITDLPVYQDYLEAKETVGADPELQEQIQSFERLREEFVMARQAGDATNEDLRELQRTQQELHEQPKMAAFLEAKSELELRLQELNERVSEPLAVDFGRTAGGCCED
jgi:cell fate (sporulation/competence/biofilm development) regulator YlbF (YheA/YmcA/DUF963 family)